MQVWTKHSIHTQDVAVLLLPRFSNHCLANAIEPLRAANDFLMREAYRWQFVTLDGRDVMSSSGLPVKPNGRLRDHPGGDVLVIMSSYDVRHYATPATARALLAAAKRFNSLVGMDTGAWLMADAGLLNGRTATIHWDELTAFSESFGAVNVVADRVIYDEDFITCGGAMTAFDLILEQIRRTHGSAIALDVASLFLHHSSDASRPPTVSGRATPIVQRCLDMMMSNLEVPLAINTLAERLQTNQKTLNRGFHAEFGAPPAAVYKRIRLAEARRLVRYSNHSIAEIAVRSGYTNPAAMTRAFVNAFGVTPSSLRQKSA